MFEWDASNQIHVARHDILPYEAEQAATDPRRVLIEERIVNGEQRLSYVGRTNAGRIIVVVEAPYGERVRVVTAYEATGWKRREYPRV